jgi:Zn-dependent peptidase ImmA (M78 family)
VAREDGGMEVSPQSFGKASSLGFVLQWEHDHATSSVSASRGWLSATVADVEVWPFGGPGTESWPWIELLEFFGRYWRYIEFEVGGDPLGLDVQPDLLRTAAEQRWRSLSEEDSDREEEALLGYLRSHNLAAAFRGASAPALYIVRRNVDTAQLTADGVNVELPWGEVRDTLTALGAAIAARLEPVREPRSENARAQWASRSPTEASLRLALAMGRSLEDARRVEAVCEDKSREIELWPFAVAARMAPERMSVEALAALMVELCRPDHLQVSSRFLELRANAQRIRGTAESQGLRRYEVGQAVARWLRHVFGTGPELRFDIDQALSELGIEIRAVTVDEPAVDALCAFGPSRPPVVVLNQRGVHASSPNGRRATLAHELYHLLVDLGTTLPYAEANSVRAPRFIEQRARAFAAELLLPRVVAEQTAAAVAVGQLTAETRRLSAHYGASRELVTLQLYNARERASADAQREIESEYAALRLQGD